MHRDTLTVWTYLLVALAWIVWCTVHSLLITATVNDWIQRKGGRYQALYRLAYIIFSLLSLLPVLGLEHHFDQKVVFVWHGPWRLLQGGLLLYALVMFWGGKQVYDLDYFLGLAQWRAYRQRASLAEFSFRSRGVLQYVRHPWYSGGIALLLALEPVTDLSLVSRTILILYLVVGTILEERKLVRELGPRYEQYRSRVPMLVPWKGKVVAK